MKNKVFRQIISLVLCTLLLLSSSVFAFVDAPDERSFIQLTAFPTNEPLSTVRNQAGRINITQHRAFNPEIERAILSFAMRYGQGARIEIYELIDGATPGDVHATDPRGAFVGYLFGEFEGVAYTFDFSGVTDEYTDLEYYDESDYESYYDESNYEAVDYDCDISDYTDDDATDCGNYYSDYNIDDAADFSNYETFMDIIAAEYYGYTYGTDEEYYQNDSIDDYDYYEANYYEEYDTIQNDEPAYDTSLTYNNITEFDRGSRIAFRGYEGWLPELLEYDPYGLLSSTLTPFGAGYVNSIVWDGYVVDADGNQLQLLDGDYVIVIQPIAASQSENRIYLPIAVSSAIMPAILGFPRGNSAVFGAFGIIPGTHEINVMSGNYFFRITDLTAPSNPPLAFVRAYNSQAAQTPGRLGNGWRTGFDYALIETASGATVVFPDGASHDFQYENGVYSAPQAVDFILERSASGWTMIDRSRNVYVFDYEGRITSLTALNGESLTFTYNGDLLVSVANRTGSLAMEYDNNGRIITVTATPGGRSVTYEYDNLGNLIAVVDHTGRTMTYGYDNDGRLISMTDPSGWNFLNLEFDEYNRLTSARVGSATTFNTLVYGELYTISTDQNGRTKRYNFNIDRQVTSIEHHDGTEYFEFEDGRLVAETARNGRTVRYEYDERGNITRIIGADGAYTRFTFNENNLPIRIDRVNPDGVMTTRLYEYDARGNVISHTDENGNVRTFTFDAYNRPITSTDNYGNTTEFRYDQYGRLTTIVTPDGGELTTEYDANGNIIRTVTAMGFVTEFVRDAAGHLIEIIDPEGNSTHFEVDNRGNITAVIDALGGRVETTFNEASLPLTITDQLGNVTLNAFDVDGNLLSTTAPDGGVTTFVYGIHGELLSKTDARGNTWTFAYDSQWRQTGISGPLGQTFSVSYDANGNMVSFTSGRGYTTRVEHNADNRIAATTDPEGGVTRFEYDSRGNLTARIDPNGNRWEFVYDSNDRLIVERDPLGGETSFIYDARGNLIEVRTPMSNTREFAYDLDGRLIGSTDGESNVTRYEHNRLGQLTRVVYADGSYMSFVYDALGRVVLTIKPCGAETIYEYDAASRLIRVTNALGYYWQYEYDSMGRLITKIDPMGGITRLEYDLNGNLLRTINALGYETVFEYDELNRLVSVRDPRGGTTRFEHDLDNNLTRTINADGGVISYTFDGNNRLTRMSRAIGNGETADTILVFDPAGNIVSITDPMSNTTHLGYDALNRNIYVDLPDGGREEFEYDADGRLIRVVRRVATGQYAVTHFEYNRNGRVTRITDALGNSVSFVYDALGRIIEEIDQGGNRRRFEYNANGQVIRFTDPLGNITDFGYDALGRLIWESNPRANQWEPLYRTWFEYDANGRITSMTDPLGRVTRFTHDALGRILTVTDALGGVTTYEYDANGNIVRTIDALGNASVFGYDSMNRLVSAQLAGQSQATLYVYDLRGLVVQTVTPAGGTAIAVYDRNGNLISRTDANGNTSTYEFDPLNRVIQMNFADGKQASFAYDYAGNLTSLFDWTGLTTFEHDILGRIVTITDPNNRTIDYTYDSRSNRTSITVTDPASLISATTTYTFDAANRMSTLTDSAGTTTTFAYFPTGLLRSTRSTTGEATDYTYDALGNRLTANHSRDGVPRRSYRWVYDGLGRVLSETRDNIGIGITPMPTHSINYRYDALSRLIRYYAADGRITNYSYDPSGNMLSSRTTRQGQLVSSTDFTYNTAGQLVSRVVTENGITNTHSYVYDAMGNLIRETLNGQMLREFTYDARNRMVLGVNANGETTAYTFNALGIRVSSETTTRNVNFSHQSNINGVLDSELSVGTARTGSQHVSTIAESLEEMTGQRDTSTWFDVASTTRQAEYFTARTYYVSDFTSFLPRDIMIITEEYTQILEYGLELHSVTTIITGQHETLNTIIAATRPRLYARHNHLGGVSYFINELGVLQSYNEFNPWGVQYTNRATDQNFVSLNLGVTGFTGLAYDTVLGIYFAHFRMYDQEAMRFTAVDPIRGNILNPQTINPYLYVLNSPTNFVDPWGLSPTIPVRATAEAAGAEVTWNQDTRTATVSMNGLTMNFVDGQGGSFVNDEWRMQVDASALDAFLAAAGSAGSSNIPFPPNFWGDLVDEIAAHNPGMSSADIHAMARDMVSILGNNPSMFLMMVEHALSPSIQQPVVSVVTALFGLRDDAPLYGANGAAILTALNLDAFQTPQEFTRTGGGLTVTRDGNNVTIIANFYFRTPGWIFNQNRIPNAIWSGSESDISYADAFMQGVRYHWGGTFGEYTVTVETRTATRAGGAIPVTILYGHGVSNHSSTWTARNRGSITMFQGDVCRVDLQTPTVRYDLSQFMWVSAHEFGHALGLRDVVGVDSIMYDFRMDVTERDITMLLHAVYTGTRQPRE